MNRRRRPQVRPVVLENPISPGLALGIGALGLAAIGFAIFLQKVQAPWTFTPTPAGTPGPNTQPSGTAIG